ncbi:MAG TPA: NAD(P)-dependent oxidoreductase [bacterium]
MRQAPSAARPVVVVPDDINDSFAQSPELARLRAVADVQLHPTRPADESALITRLRSADVVLSFRPAFTRFPAPVLRAAEKLRMVCISGTGVEDVDVAEATARGVAVSNVVGSSNRAVAEMCLALMLAVARRVAVQDRAIRRGQWAAQQGIELGGRTLGLIGLSGISSELAPLGQALGMDVISWSRNNDPARARAVGATAVEFDEVLARAHVISLHVRLNDATRALIGAPQFARMQPGAIFINTARGGIVNEAALLDALRSGHLGGAGLDVFAAEPLPAGHPLLAMDNVVMTPVAGWNTSDASHRMICRSIDNVIGFLSGKPINVVNPEALGAAAR